MRHSRVTSKFDIQDAQYSFPYHYVPRFDRGKFSSVFALVWGHEYMSYLRACMEEVVARDWTALLDVGCGDGRLASIAKGAFPNRNVYGVDMSERAIALAQAFCPEVNFIVGDITEQGLFGGRKFDVLTCIETLEHIEPTFLPSFVAAMRSHANDGAKLIVTVPSMNKRLQKKHFQHFTAKTLSATLERHFEPVEIGYMNGSDRLLKFVQKVMHNGLFSIRSGSIQQRFYDWYVRRYGRSTPDNGQRVFGVFRAV